MSRRQRDAGGCPAFTAGAARLRRTQRITHPWSLDPKARDADPAFRAATSPTPRDVGVHRRPTVVTRDHPRVRGAHSRDRTRPLRGPANSSPVSRRAHGGNRRAGQNSVGLRSVGRHSVGLRSSSVGRRSRSASPGSGHGPSTPTPRDRPRGPGGRRNSARRVRSTPATGGRRPGNPGPSLLGPQLLSRRLLSRRLLGGRRHRRRPMPTRRAPLRRRHPRGVAVGCPSAGSTRVRPGDAAWWRWSPSPCCCARVTRGRA